MDMESLEKAAAAAAPEDDETVYVQQPQRPRIKKRSRRFKCALHLRAAEIGDLRFVCTRPSPFVQGCQCAVNMIALVLSTSCIQVLEHAGKQHALIGGRPLCG